MLQALVIRPLVMAYIVLENPGNSPRSPTIGAINKYTLSEPRPPMVISVILQKLRLEVAAQAEYAEAGHVGQKGSG